MRYIQLLIETVLDETGIAPQVVITLNKDGWRARVCEDGVTLLDSAGEQFLSARGYDTPAEAIAALEQITKIGYSLSQSWSRA